MGIEGVWKQVRDSAGCIRRKTMLGEDNRVKKRSVSYVRKTGLAKESVEKVDAMGGEVDP